MSLGGADVAQPIDDRHLEVVGDLWRRLHEDLVEAACHDVERDAAELAREAVAVGAGAELSQRRGGLGDFMVEGGKEIGHGRSRLHRAEGCRRETADLRIGVGEGPSKRTDRRRAPGLREGRHGGAAKRDGPVPGIPDDRVGRRFGLRVAESINRSHRQTGREPLLEKVSDALGKVEELTFMAPCPVYEMCMNRRKPDEPERDLTALSAT